MFYQSSGSKPEAQSKSVQKHIESLQSVEENRESEPTAEQLNDGTIIVANQLKNHKGHEARGCQPLFIQHVLLG